MISIDDFIFLLGIITSKYIIEEDKDNIKSLVVSI